MVFALGELAKVVGGRVVGEEHCEIDGVASLDQATVGQISFLTSPQFRKYLSDTAASAVIIKSDDLELCKVNALIVDDPSVAYARIATLLYPQTKDAYSVHPTAVVSPDSKVSKKVWIGPYCVIEAGAVITDDVRLGPGCVIGKNAIIGENSQLEANVIIWHDTVIGHHALIHSGVVIGSDGFGFANDKGVWIKIPQLGRVRIGNDVEIGANTTIDRGTLEDTVIDDGVKLDNQIQVAHNVRIGAHTVIAACTGIAGSAKIGKHCAIGGAVGIGGHLEIVDNVQITGKSMVTKSIKEPGLYSSGIPLDTNQKWHRNVARFRQLDDMAHKLRQLEKLLTTDNKG